MPTKIEWTHGEGFIGETWNPIVGCTKVSTGCTRCYAKTIHDKRHKAFLNGKKLPIQYAKPFETVQLKPERLDQPLHWKKPRMIFVNSMSDLFHEDIPFEFIDKVFDTMANTERHTFQVLTKRPDRMLEYLKLYTTNFNGNYDFEMMYREEVDGHNGSEDLICSDSEWPLPNVWLGISCENQATADERIPILLQVPAAVRFLSCEPLLDPINLFPHIKGFGEENIHWVICGGESGPGYRPMNLDWARSIRDQCKDAGVPFFFKQTAGKKEIPEDLQIREYPK